VELSATQIKVPYYTFSDFRDGGHLLNPLGSPLESHIFPVTIFPVNRYYEIQLEIILNISNKNTTYTGQRETDGLQ